MSKMPSKPVAPVYRKAHAIPPEFIQSQLEYEKVLRPHMYGDEETVDEGDTTYVSLKSMLAKGATHIRITHNKDHYDDYSTVKWAPVKAIEPTTIVNPAYEAALKANARIETANEADRNKYGKELAAYNKEMRAWEKANPELHKAAMMLLDSGYKVE